MGRNPLRPEARILTSNGHYRVAPDETAVACWCETSVLAIPTAVFHEGRTLSCGREGCREMVP